MITIVRPKDRIFDETLLLLLRANRLVPVTEIARVSARLVINLAALKLKRKSNQPLLDTFAAAAS